VGFELLPLDEPCGRLDAHPVAKALAEIEFNLVSIQVSQLARAKRILQMLGGSHVHFMSLSST